MTKCEYGCNRDAKFQMTNGRHCCSKSWNSCPGMKEKNRLANKGRVPANKGKRMPRWNHTNEVKERLSHLAKQRKLGGYIKGSGRGKKGWFNGIWCDSSYELAYVLYCNDHNIPIKKNIEKFEYVFKEKTYKYIPDFIRTDRPEYFIEIKGYFTQKDIAKIESFPYKLKVLCGNGMNKILEYVKNEYGKDFIRLYENH